MHPKFEVLRIDRIKQTITPVASVLQDPKFDKEAINLVVLCVGLTWIQRSSIF